MRLKNRPDKLEIVTQPEWIDNCIFIIGAYPKGQVKPFVIGYRCNGVEYRRLAGESDDDLTERVQSAALETGTRQACGLRAVLVSEIH